MNRAGSPWAQRVTRMIEGRGQTRSGLNHHEATGTRKEVGWACVMVYSFDSRSRPDSVAVGLSSVGYRTASAAVRARGLHAPTAPKFMD